jgi:hypothetical protein
MHAMLVAASTVLLALFSLFAAADGVLVHLVWLKLHARERSWMEHVWHTFSAVLFVPIVVTVFLLPTGGAMLWVGVSLIALLYVVEVFDVISERASRSDLGGVSRGELALHVAAMATRTLATILALASRPLEAWSLSSPPVLGAYPVWIGSVVGAMVPGAILVAAAHVVLAWRYRPDARVARAVPAVAAHP